MVEEEISIIPDINAVTVYVIVLFQEKCNFVTMYKIDVHRLNSISIR